jgi:hypothetical protein
MAAVELNKAAFEALKTEAMRDFEAAVGERYRFRGEDEGNGQERLLLACADVLGVLRCREHAFKEHDHRPEVEHPGTVPVEFSDEAIWWMRDSRSSTRENLAYIDTNDEWDLLGQMREVFLLHVLDRVLGADREAVAV